MRKKSCIKLNVKKICCFLIACLMLAMTACGDSDGNKDNNIKDDDTKNNTGKSDVIIIQDSSSEDKDGNISKSDDENKIIEIETKEYIHSAIDKAKLIASDDMLLTENGDMFCKQIEDAYCYYDKDIKLARGNAIGWVIVATDDGKLYNDNTLIAENVNVKDILFRTNNVGMDASIIMDDGSVYRYETDIDDKNRLINMQYDDVVVGCRNRNSSIHLTKDGTPIESDRWRDFVDDGWENIVVMDCVQDEESLRNENEGIKTVAAIAGDGTVYAKGSYSDEILSWGELAYISMDEKLIAGLKKDGTLAFAGACAEHFYEYNLSGVEAIRVYDERFIALTKEGYWLSYIDNYSDLTFLSSDTSKSYEYNDNYYYVGSDGVIKQFDNGKWVNSTYINANNKNNIEEYIAYCGLSEKQFDWQNHYIEASNMKFQMVDVNNDGENEVLLLSGDTMRNCEGNGQGLAISYNGFLDLLLTDTKLISYYPNSGVIFTSFNLDRYTSYDNYYLFKEGKVIKVASKYVDKCNMDDIQIKYYAGETGDIEGEENEDGKVQITESQFNDLLEKYVDFSDEVIIDYDKYMENNKENWESYFAK